MSRFQLLVIQEHKEIGDKKNYCVQVYEPNPESFSDLNENNVQGERLNTISPHESENKEEILGNSLMELPKDVNMVLKKSHDISPFKLFDSPPTMLDVQYVKYLEQHVHHPPSRLTSNMS